MHPRAGRPRAGAPPSDRWWLPIGALVVLGPALAVVSMVSPPDAFASLLGAPLVLLGAALAVLSPVFVHLDRRYVAARAAWDPSGWYSLMPLPPLAFVLPAVYLYQRHRHVGVP